MTAEATKSGFGYNPFHKCINPECDQEFQPYHGMNGMKCHTCDDTTDERYKIGIDLKAKQRKREMISRCAICLQVKDVGEFTVLKNGKPYSYCKKCVSEKSKEHYQKNKEKICEDVAARKKSHKDSVDAYKMQIGCMHCGYAVHPSALEFHHTDDNKEGNVATMYSHSREKLFAEVEKCQVLCANCHRIEHAEGRKYGQT